jgi:hypothetical protein
MHCGAFEEAALRAGHLIPSLGSSRFQLINFTIPTPTPLHIQTNIVRHSIRTLLSCYLTQGRSAGRQELRAMWSTSCSVAQVLIPRKFPILSLRPMYQSHPVHQIQAHCRANLSRMLVTNLYPLLAPRKYTFRSLRLTTSQI